MIQEKPDKPDKTRTPDNGAEETGPPLTSLEFDFERYDRYLESDLSEEERRCVLEALWNVIISLVDVGFGMDATQLACGKLLQSAFEDSFTDSDGLESDIPLANEFKDAADMADTKGVHS